MPSGKNFFTAGFPASDAEFIAHARADLPAALDRIDELGMKLAAANSQLAEIWPRLSAVTEAVEVERDAPAHWPLVERVAWADGWTDACDFIRAAITGAGKVRDE